jgi:hypothetical protein
VFTVFELEVTDGVIRAIRVVVNPDKLGHVGSASDVARLPEKELPHHTQPSAKEATYERLSGYR